MFSGLNFNYNPNVKTVEIADKINNFPSTILKEKKEYMRVLQILLYT